MDWSRCDEIEYDTRYENNNIVHTGKASFEMSANKRLRLFINQRENSFEMQFFFSAAQIESRFEPFAFFVYLSDKTLFFLRA